VRLNRVVVALDAIGNALILQLLCFVFSLPVVTLLPAAAALQRQLQDLRAGHPTGAASFAREFRRTWRASWPLGVVAPLVAIGFAVALPFWFAVQPPLGWVGSGILAFLLGLACGWLINLLWAAEALRDGDWRAWSRAGFVHLAGHALRSLWGVLLLGCWLVVLLNFPALALVGSGLVPALIVHFTVTERDRPPGYVEETAL
jgi:hypothetical protein